MGLSAACQLAAKGANIIIIARNQQKLDAALAEIKVSERGHVAPYEVATYMLTLSFSAIRPLPNLKANASMLSKQTSLSLTMHPQSSLRPLPGTMASLRT